MRERIRFSVPDTNDIISKSGNAGKLGIRLDKNLSMKLKKLFQTTISFFLLGLFNFQKLPTIYEKCYS